MSDETKGADTAPVQADVLDAPDARHAPEVQAFVLDDRQGPVLLDVDGDVVRIDRIGGAFRVPVALVVAFRAAVGVPADA